MKAIYNVFSNVEELKSIYDVKVAVVIFTCKPQREPIVYEVGEGEDMDEEVLTSVKQLTSGCNYTYTLIKKIDNVYFFE